MENLDLNNVEIANKLPNMNFPEIPSVIADFYAGLTVFITGGTGFLGKLLIEKLLRSCPDIKKIYVMVRAKKGKDMETRFKEIFNEPIFGNMMKDRLEPPETVEAVAGDCGLLGLGMSEEDKIKLQNEVNIVIHGAATVRFDEKLNIAVKINVRGTREIIDLVKTFHNFLILVHISTAFSHCPRQKIEEHFYKSPIQPENLINLMDSMDESNIEMLTPALINPWPNTYSYTKAVAEEVLRTRGQGIIITIVRPSIVIGTAKEPLPGWINNIYGPSGVLVGAGMGILTALHCDPDALADMVPADYVINSVIAASWDVATEQNVNQTLERNTRCDMEPKIFNYVSAHNSITWDKFAEISYNKGFPPIKAIWYVGGLSLSKNKMLYQLQVLLKHTIPAILIDTAMKMIGKKPVLVSVYKKIHKFSAVLSFFSLNQWEFTNENTQILSKKLSTDDRKTFNFDMSLLNWEDYMSVYLLGCRIYLLKDGVETIPRAIVRMKRMQIAHYTLRSLLWLGLLYILWALFGLLNVS